jgi:photosystem II stability/assembly factor-like uncharacterized protein
MEPSRFEARTWLRKAAFLGAALLLALIAGSPREIRVHGQWLEMGKGLPPARGEEEIGGGDERRERLMRWLESRHRAAPGFDWHAIEAANRQAALELVAAKARGPQPVWHERGPLNMTGSTVVTAIRPDGRTLLVGSGQGGLFSGTPGGRAWTRLTDSLGGFLEGFAVSSPPETWVAAVSSRNDGRVYVSRNRGATWSAARGLPPLFTIYQLVQDGGDHRTIYLLALIQQDNGAVLPILARSRDGGLSFSVVYTGGTSYERPGLWTSRTGAGPLYRMSQGRLFVSTDHGSSFSPLGETGVRQANYAVLCGSEAGAPTLYAAVGQSFRPSDLFVSEDGGRTWESRFQFKDTRLFGSSLAASPSDPGLVLFGSQDAWRSADGGRTFAMINDWPAYYSRPADKLHADIRGLQFVNYKNRETLFLDTDGGTYMSTDGGAGVQNITQNGLGNAQLYSTWSSASDPDLFLAGSQDQGFQRSIPPHGGSRVGAPLGTVQVISGDYSGLTSASHDLSNVFAVYPGALLVLAASGDPLSALFAPLPKMSASGFFAATAADPDDPSTVYVAGDHIWKLRYLGGTDLAQTELPQDFSPDKVDYVSALAIAPADHSFWYAATSEGHLWYSRDHGDTWTESATTGERLPYSSNSALLVSADDPLTCFAGGSGYGSPPVLVTRDGGAHWSPLSTGLPSTVVWSLAFDGPATKTLYAATDAGPFVFNAATSTWRSLLGGGSPVVTYYSVEGVPSQHLVRFGTYGRGVWDYVVPRP